MLELILLDLKTRLSSLPSPVDWESICKDISLRKEFLIHSTQRPPIGRQVWSSCLGRLSMINACRLLSQTVLRSASRTLSRLQEQTKQLPPALSSQRHPLLYLQESSSGQSPLGKCVLFSTTEQSCHLLIPFVLFEIAAKTLGQEMPRRKRLVA